MNTLFESQLDLFSKNYIGSHGGGFKERKEVLGWYLDNDHKYAVGMNWRVIYRLKTDRDEDEFLKLDISLTGEICNPTISVEHEYKHNRKNWGYDIFYFTKSHFTEADLNDVYKQAEEKLSWYTRLNMPNDLIADIIGQIKQKAKESEKK